VGDDRVAIVQRQPEELPTTARLGERATDEYGLEVARAGGMTTYGSRVQDAGAEDRAAGDDSSETRTYGLDFG
jgi:hypothetical protein